MHRGEIRFLRQPSAAIVFRGVRATFVFTHAAVYFAKECADGRWLYLYRVLTWVHENRVFTTSYKQFNAESVFTSSDVAFEAGNMRTFESSTKEERKEEGLELIETRFMKCRDRLGCKSDGLCRGRKLKSTGLRHGRVQFSPHESYS